MAGRQTLAKGELKAKVKKSLTFYKRLQPYCFDYFPPVRESGTDYRRANKHCHDAHAIKSSDVASNTNITASTNMYSLRALPPTGSGQ